jgi:hypothetical protein
MELPTIQMLPKSPSIWIQQCYAPAGTVHLSSSQYQESFFRKSRILHRRDVTFEDGAVGDAANGAARLRA